MAKKGLPISVPDLSSFHYIILPPTVERNSASIHRLALTARSMSSPFFRYIKKQKLAIANLLAALVPVYS